MIPTFKRDPLSFKTNNKNYNKHFNHISFKGIVQQNNIYEVDQLSLKDAVNIYRDEDLVLTSRYPLTKSKIPIVTEWKDGNLIKSDLILENYDLVDMIESGPVTIYISKYDEWYRIVAKLNEDNTIVVFPFEVNKYHVSVIERYIIVFNNLGAQVLETNKFTEGWKSLQNYVEIPITKRVVGQDLFEYPLNQFTESYKEEYVWSNEVLTMLPEGDAEATVNQSPKSITWTLPNANINTEFRIMRPLTIKLEPNDIVTSAFNRDLNIPILCIAKNGYVLISFTGGVSFQKVLYPADSTFLNVASVSKSGSHFFFVSREGVYRYTIGSEEGEEGAWQLIKITTTGYTTTLQGSGYHNTCNFYNSETFAFVLADNNDNIYVYAKSPDLQITTFDIDTLSFIKIENVPVNDYLNKAHQDLSSNRIAINIDALSMPIIALALPTVNSDIDNTIVYTIIGKGATDAETILCLLETPNKTPYMSIQTVKKLEDNEVEITGLISNNNFWYAYTGVFDSNQVITLTMDKSTNIPVTHNLGAPIDLSHGYIMNKTTYSVDGVADIPNELMSLARRSTIAIGASYYIHLGDTLYSNQMTMEENAVIAYTRLSDTNFTEVPQVSHTNNELYLGFGDTLKITSNEQTGTEIIFNLPAINNQTFVSSVNGILTISTTEVAIFLKDKIFVVTQTPDELLGYAYTYHNTRLSTGVRPYDDVINSIDGVFTFYPTKQGLAVMNYQPDVATTDQAVEYVTKDITKLWTDFYTASDAIKLVQMNDYIFLSNETNQYLMLDLRGLTWWKFEIPIPVLKIVTDQFDLKIIGNGLYEFNKETQNYRDFGTNFINWRVESQPLHFDLPSHYKNIRQIIYQLEESTDSLQTMLSQIKLYRKSITYRDPDILRFKVDGYKTYVKRFNYWKVNELQWAIGADPDTETPAQLRLTGITIKFEPGEEVRS